MVELSDTTRAILHQLKAAAARTIADTFTANWRMQTTMAGCGNAGDGWQGTGRVRRWSNWRESKG